MQRLKEVHQPKRPSPAGKGTTTQGVYWDGRRKFHGDRHLLFELTRYEVRPDWGTPYPCNVKNLASYRRRPKKTRKKPLCNELATSKLVKFLNEPIVEGSKERAALYRLASGMQLQEWGPDLIIKAFDDIDLVFFRGVLATRTQISYWTEQQIRAEGELSPVLGFCNNLGYGRSHIVLNSSRIFLQCRDPFAQMWTTMLHEMVVRGDNPDRRIMN
ncbi:MAG: hypothetical protein LQ338_000239 [Usnochroma carphineum]|nr:MAG: hypothetical protein LQ338_000239 [Usnochroma carphineum]